MECYEPTVQMHYAPILLYGTGSLARLHSKNEHLLTYISEDLIKNLLKALKRLIDFSGILELTHGFQ